MFQKIGRCFELSAENEIVSQLVPRFIRGGGYEEGKEHIVKDPGLRLSVLQLQADHFQFVTQMNRQWSIRFSAWVLTHCAETICHDVTVPQEGCLFLL